MPGAGREGNEGAFKAVVGKSEVERSREMFCEDVRGQVSWEKCVGGFVGERR